MTNRRLAFLLEGKVQGVKMRRYVEAAGRHFRLGGFCVNTAEGAVFGEAWAGQSSDTSALSDFQCWLQGQWEPKVYHNIKPTPIGTAYPAKARVDRAFVLMLDDDFSRADDRLEKRFQKFTMVRDDVEADTLASERINIQERLSEMEKSSMSWHDS